MLSCFFLQSVKNLPILLFLIHDIQRNYTIS